ncbi:MAG: hypothetical protein GX256_07230 [Fretibacterium sp.]|nr:hypothetical protein [Fretibacterium sp.]
MRSSVLRKCVAVMVGVFILGGVALAAEGLDTELLELLQNDPDPKEVEALLEAGADVNAEDGMYMTPLMLAASWCKSNSEVLRILINAGADVNARAGNGATALIWAARYNPNPEAITILLDAGADAKETDVYSDDALHYAKNNKALEGTDALRRLEEASR